MWLLTLQRQSRTKVPVLSCCRRLVLPRRVVLLWFSFSKGFPGAPFAEPELRSKRCRPRVGIKTSRSGSVSQGYLGGLSPPCPVPVVLGLTTTVTRADEQEPTVPCAGGESL